MTIFNAKITDSGTNLSRLIGNYTVNREKHSKVFLYTDYKT